MIEKIQRLADSQDRQEQGRKWGPRRTTRYQMHYGCQEEEEENWRIQNNGEMRHQSHHMPQHYNFKLPSFDGNCDPNVNVYLGWEAKVEQIFSVYDVDEEQRVKLTSIEFEDHAMHTGGIKL